MPHILTKQKVQVRDIPGTTNVRSRPNPTSISSHHAAHVLGRSSRCKGWSFLDKLAASALPAQTLLHKVAFHKVAGSANQRTMPPAQGFDPDSGQVYVERTCRAAPMTPNWTWKTRGTIKSVTKYTKAGSGCASLRDTSIRRFLANSFYLTPETLGPLPSHLKRQLWLEIKRNELDSLRNWKVFAAAFANDTELDESFEGKKLTLPDSAPILAEYTRHISSPSLTWITFLTLTSLSCTRTNLIQVSRLTNLGMLTIGTSDPVYDTGLEDNVVRAWGRAASEAGAFTKLRILVCRSQFNMTSKVFTYLQHLPALDMLLLDGRYCNHTKFSFQAKKHEWEAVDEGRFRAEPFAIRTFAWKDIYGNLSAKGALFNLNPVEDNHEGRKHLEPILDITLGAKTSPSQENPLKSKDLWLLRGKSRCSGTDILPTVDDKKRLLEQDSRAGILSSKKRVVRSSWKRTSKDLLADFQAQ
ncbi:MAG: hypothetical protein L6R40_002255 [Gallowayella cf. fulva]|nr:MAG: hypothetical protein L6R40_002255 [Xanthomendoza cf. fulva]